jgi:hypothetical protein
MNKQFKAIYQEELKKLEDKMNKRDRLYQELENYKFKHGKIPNEYLPDWTAYITDGKKPWYKVPGVRKKIKAAARKAAENRMKSEKNN